MLGLYKNADKNSTNRGALGAQPSLKERAGREAGPGRGCDGLDGRKRSH